MREVSLILLYVLIFLLATEQSALANYRFGVVGCYSRENVTNMPKERGEIYKNLYDMLMDELGNMPGVVPCDLSLEAMRARMDEVYLQLMMQEMDKGNTAVVIDDFEVHPDYLIYGYLTGLTITHREASFRANYAVRADISIRVLEAETGKVVFVSTGTGDVSSHVYPGGKKVRVGSDIVAGDCLHAALEKACEQVGKKIRSSI